MGILVLESEKGEILLRLYVTENALFAQTLFAQTGNLPVVL
jgi:hypothetical protein